MNEVMIFMLAAIAHAVNAAYCKAIGDDSQMDWDSAPQWQKDSAANGVRHMLANPNATPEQMHESWLFEKEEAGWVYGEVKDEKQKTHPCMLPYDELPKAQRVKDYLFQAVVKAFLAGGFGQLQSLRDELADTKAKMAKLLLTIPASATNSKKAGLAVNMVLVRYVGKRDYWEDNLYNTGLSFSTDQERDLPASVAAKLLKHGDLFLAVGGSVSSEGDIEIEAQQEASKEEDSDVQHYEVLDQIERMDKQALIQFAAERYQVKIDARKGAESVRGEVVELVNKFGVL